MICSSYEPTIGMLTRTVIEDSICARCGEPKASHPAEAATRENGDLAQRIRALEFPEFLKPANARDHAVYGAAVDIASTIIEHELSTHQQQGAESDQRLIKSAMDYASWDGIPSQAVAFIALLCRRLEALSRAPQPDTVTETPWKPMSAIPDFMDCPSHILVWNNCNGVSEIAVDPDDIYKFRYDGDGWLLWREVPEPTDVEKAAALKEPK